MRIIIHLPWTIIRKDHLKDIEAAKADFMFKLHTEQENFEKAVRKAIHGAYAGIVCATCGKNVFTSKKGWVHGNGGKAYCLEPCWKKLQKK